jgi:hypothetical protein
MTSSGLSEYALKVEGQKVSSPAIQKILVPAHGLPTPPGAKEADHRLNISVVFTSVELTLAALEEAGTLANSLGAQIKLLVPWFWPARDEDRARELRRAGHEVIFRETE